MINTPSDDRPFAKEWAEFTKDKSVNDLDQSYASFAAGVELGHKNAEISDLALELTDPYVKAVNAELIAVKARLAAAHRELLVVIEYVQAIKNRVPIGVVASALNAHRILLSK